MLLFHSLLHAALAQPATSPTVESACTDDLPGYVEEVRRAGRFDAYTCLSKADPAGPLLLGILQNPPAESVGHERVGRAYALHMLRRMDVALTAEQSRALLPADRRLVRDGVYARRGRQSPSPDHHRVFEQLDWYSPDSKFTNRRLTEVDRANLNMLDNPPEPPKPATPATAADAMAEVPTARSPGTGGICGCNTTTLGALGAWPLALLGLVMARRRA